MFLFLVCRTFVIAAVNVVLPWSMCPIVPMFTCGFVRSNFALAIAISCAWKLAGARTWRRSPRHLGDDLLADGARHFLVAGKLHGVGRPPLGHGADVGGI